MKMKYFFTFVMGAALAFACNKAEIESGNDSVQTEEGSYTIQTEILNSKTSYDADGKFSWENSEKITVVVYNDGTTDASKINKVDHWSFTNSTGAGATASFTGTAISAPWHETGIALYPNVNATNKNCLKEAGAYDTGVLVNMQQEIQPNLSNPLAVVPLIGRKNSQGVYQFQTATGILKVTLENIPSDAYYVYLQDPSSGFAFAADYSIGESCEIKEENAVSNINYKKTIAFSPAAPGETRSFYFPVPTGTIPAGTVLKLDSSSSNNLMTKTFKNTVSITAGHVTPLASVYVCPADVSELFGRYKIAGNGTNGSDEAFITLASTDEVGYDLRISRYENTTAGLDLSGSCLGKYDRANGTITFSSMQLFADTGDTWSDASQIYYSFRSYDNTGQNLVLYINSGTELSTKDKRFDFSKFVSSYSSTSGYLEFKKHGASTLTKR